MELHTHIRSALRGAWLRSENRNEALKNARLRRGIYRCYECKKECKKKEIDIDHIIRVGATPGSTHADETTDWNGFIERLFIPSDGLAVLCKQCHSNKRDRFSKAHALARARISKGVYGCELCKREIKRKEINLVVRTDGALATCNYCEHGIIPGDENEQG